MDPMQRPRLSQRAGRLQIKRCVAATSWLEIRSMAKKRLVAVCLYMENYQVHQ